MAQGHETVVALAQVRLTKEGARVFKNQMGQGFAGKVVGEYDSSGGHVVELLGARRLKFGVCSPGGSDLIGWKSVIIRPEHVGQRVAIFAAIECKTPGYDKASPEQKRFLGEVAKAGGVALIARREGEDGVGFEEIEP